MHRTLLADLRRLTFAPSVSDVKAPTVSRRWSSLAVVTCIGSLALALAACSHDGREMRPPRPDQNQTIIPPTEPATQPVGFDTAAPDDVDFALTLPWTSGDTIPAQYVCGGEAPTISWANPPVGSVALAIVVTDLDAPMADRPDLPFVHWAVANIDVGLSTMTSIPAGAVEAANDFSSPTAPSIGWGAPCPPEGETHTYSFELHALGQAVELPSGSSAADMVVAIELASVGRATASGVVAG